MWTRIGPPPHDAMIMTRWLTVYSPDCAQDIKYVTDVLQQTHFTGHMVLSDLSCGFLQLGVLMEQRGDGAAAVGRRTPGHTHNKQLQHWCMHTHTHTVSVQCVSQMLPDRAAQYAFGQACFLQQPIV